MSALNRLVKVIGDGCMIFSIPLIMIGVAGLAGGYGIMFHIGGEVASPQEGGQMTLIVGIILLLAGIVITTIRKMKIVNF
jgi:ABC-type multidrug transport system fused ATPase/permease subunit